MSTLHRCLCYSQTSLIQPPKGQSVHIAQVTVLQSNLLNTPPKGQSVHIAQVTVLQSNLLNTPPKGQCPNYGGSLIADEPP